MKTTNPDIPKKQHRKVRIYKEQQDLDYIPKAYQKILEKGLNMPDKAYKQIEQHAEQNNTSIEKSANQLIQKGLKEVKNK